MNYKNEHLHLISLEELSAYDVFLSNVCIL